MDVTLQEELEVARTIVEEIVGDRGLTLLINNAGILQREAFPYVTPENLELHFRVNTVAPLMVLQTMLPLLEKAASFHSDGMSIRKAAVLNISSTLGSITNAGFAKELKVPGYQISKAALNMAMRVTAASIREKGILVIMMCPGWVKTDMGGPDAQLTPDESVGAILKTLTTLNEIHHGILMDKTGNECPF
ncbi:C-factor-like [Stegodyphus dumicola]|uniref:C-factor-like n=1 Tax=Stegodyphus dumicola TaxID=202533 RepID=UPI0015B111CF|nr:C-factor-like [Stegodyphus dumicola]